MISQKWKAYTAEEDKPTMISLQKNLLHAKSLSMSWAKSTFPQDDRALLTVEEKITELHGIYLDARKAINTIWKVKDQDGMDCVEFDQIARATVQHYKQNLSLMEPITMVELHKVIKSFQQGKSPGLDRWMIEFFTGFWDMLPHDLLVTVEESKEAEDCFKSVSYLVLINNSASSFFISSWGLHQGCPLSPLLFLIVVEAFCKHIHHEIWEGNLKGVKISDQLHISHIMFVDDILLFGTATTQNAKCLDHILKLFSSCTSMEINPHKSSIFFFHVPQGILDMILKFLPFTIVKEKNWILVSLMDFSRWKNHFRKALIANTTLLSYDEDRMRRMRNLGGGAVSRSFGPRPKPNSLYGRLYITASSHGTIFSREERRPMPGECGICSSYIGQVSLIEGGMECDWFIGQVFSLGWELLGRGMEHLVQGPWHSLGDDHPSITCHVGPVDHTQ
eukprot:Gb_04908 [translate_table: standard]